MKFIVEIPDKRMSLGVKKAILNQGYCFDDNVKARDISDLDLAKKAFIGNPYGEIINITKVKE